MAMDNNTPEESEWPTPKPELQIRESEQQRAEEERRRQAILWDWKNFDPNKRSPKKDTIN